MKKPLHMLTGVNIGDYEFNPDTILDVIKKYKFGKENGGVFNYLALRMDQDKPSSERLYEWAKYLRDNEVYFSIVNCYPRAGELKSYLTKEEKEKVAEIAGDYYLGEEIGEFGSWYATKAKGYGVSKISENAVQGLKNAKEATETYIRQIKKVSDMMHATGSDNVTSLQAVTFNSYDYDAGIEESGLELALPNMEPIMAFGRGAERAYKKDVLGSWLAHEFYGGYRQFDPLKAKRFKMEYYTMYLAGIDYTCLESGYRGLYSHVDEPLSEDHPMAKSYLKEAEDFAKFCNEDIRPGKDGPITKVAFVRGNYDGFAFGNSSSLWGQYFDKKWGYSSPEFSYRIFEDIYRSSEWNDSVNFGDFDYSAAPGYGMYDIIPATTPPEELARYDWIIFCGWNTMTPEIADNFKKYAEQGGNLFITAAHMRDSVERDKKGDFCDYDWQSLLGVELSDEVINSNDGFKFVYDSIIDGMQYPGTRSIAYDPYWSAGYTDYVRINPTTAKPVCYMSDAFRGPRKDETPESMGMIPVVTENKVGEGNVIFMATSEYPGAPEVYTLYRLIVKQILAASHRTSDLKVIGSDKFRFAMFEDDDKYKLYLLNTDFNHKQYATVIFKGETLERVVDSIGLDIIEFKK